MPKIQYIEPGNTALKVSKICLGTMAFGEQNAGIESHKQLDNVIIMGINFIDTAKHYSLQGRKETQRSIQRYIGLWLKDRADSVKPNSAS